MMIHQRETTPISVRKVVAETGETTEQTASIPPTVATVSTIMTRTVYCVRPDVDIDMLAALFLEHGVSGFPVVDEAGHPIGVVSKTDVLRHLHDGGVDLARLRADEAAVLAEVGRGFHAVSVDAATVRDVMMPMVFAVGHDAPIARAAALMAGEAIHRVPVLDDDGTVCGILSTLDLVRWLADLGGYPVRH